MLLYTPDTERALRVAFEAHAGQTRKGTQLPYVTHCVHVAMLAARAGADSITIQGALLHDVVEDCEGWTIERLAHEFGADVAAVVEPLTEIKGPSWEERKLAALARVPTMDARAAAVKACDKTHNMRSLVQQLAEASSPEEAWRPFSRGPEQTIDMAERLVEAVDARLMQLDAFPSLRADLRDAYAALAKHR
ncbi:MAG: HD domain-containing protein [Planctomycetota bacterium]